MTTHDYVLRLYIAGTTLASSRAVETLRATCDEHLPGRYELTVIDVFQQPGLAKADRIIAVPALIKQLPEPFCRVVGDLESQHRVLFALDLKPLEAGHDER